jgi:hypothetical protein
VIGDAVNVAQRLSSEAGAGEILVSEAYRRVSGDVADAEQQAGLGLRGKSRAVEVFSSAAGVDGSDVGAAGSSPASPLTPAQSDKDARPAPAAEAPAAPVIPSR